MENKKSFIGNQGAPAEPPVNDTGPLMKRQGSAPDHMRLVQYGVKSGGYGNAQLGQPVMHQHPPLVQPAGMWGPVQQPPPVHYHQQRPAKQWHNATSHPPANKPPDHADHKKKSVHASNSQQLRSPAAKRPTEATVTMQGWLHKQGSEGLKVWRKRWFVLSNYCLYYYKGPEEEKLLGSILLPSYKVSLCGTEDKVYRKFAFKCEHANMRTYYLAADSQEIMMDWIRALNLACMLQSNVDSDRQSGPSVSSVYNASLDNSDSGFHQQYHTHPHPHPHPHPHAHVHAHQHAHNVPLHMHSGSNTSENPSNPSNPSYSPEVSNCVQPLYANAPPKPRRLTDGGYSSPSPEFSIDRYNNDMKHPHPQFVPPPHYSVHYAVNRNCSKSPVNVYMRNCDNRMMTAPCVSYTQSSQIPYGKVGHPIYEHQLHNTAKRDSVATQSVERRTPDTYGRSKLTSNKVKDTSDYEDVYSDEIIYKRPLSPVAYSNIKKVSPVASITVQHRPYTPVYISGPPRQETIPPPGYKICLPASQHPERIQPNTIPRPHSADFLEYEVKHRNIGKSNTANTQQPRPKSSLDISRPAGDFYYSKESYAESMRKSALYLQQLPTHYHVKGNEHLVMINGQKIYQRPNYLHGRNMQQVPCSASTQFHEKGGQPSRSGSVLSEGSLDVDLASSPYAKSPVCHLPDERDYEYPNKEFGDGQRVSPVNREYHSEQFKRSASARLVRTPTQAEKPLHEEHRPVSREGERKREESMKRLLEWKQRMLQSPLNRKLSSNLSVARGIGGRMAQPPPPPPPPAPGPGSGPGSNYEYLPTAEGRRSLTALPQYSSYSSDDEENDLDRSRKEKVVRSKLLQAGRTKEGHPDKTILTHSPAFNASATSSVFDLPLSTSADRAKDDAFATSSANDSDSVPTQPVDTSAIHDLDMNANAHARTDSVLSEHRATPQTLNQEPPNTSTADNEPSIETSHPDADDQVYEDLLITNAPVTNGAEENYMTMTPKKSLLDLRTKHHRQSSSDCEENAYMEMTRGLAISLLDQNETSNDDSLGLNNEIQAYEMVCFGENKIEPVYMELNHPSSSGQSVLSNLTVKNANDKSDLPDILIGPKNKQSKNTKSDSSDADDEASKDLDSLDAPCHPRFSLSDTFRPASYYLGASRVLTEFHDSSDSELVSPPPIPTSPPPMEDLDNSFFRQEISTDDCNSSNMADYSYCKDHKIRPHPEYLKPNIPINTAETDNCSRKVAYLSADNLKEQDSVSIYSMNTDTGKRYSRSSHNSDSDIELRPSKGSDYERMLKRRPVSEEFYDELESLDSHFNETIDSIDLDRYLKDLEVSKVGNSSKEMSNTCTVSNPVQCNDSYSINQSMPQHEYENLCMVGTSGNNDSKLSHDSSQVHKTFPRHSRDSSHDTGNYSLDSVGSHSGFMQCLRPESSASVSAEMSGLLHTSSPRSTPSIRTVNSLNIQDITPVKVSLFNQSAPYYYSDLSTNMSSRTNSSSTLLTLNNQRTATSGSKKDITRIVNPIRSGNSSRTSHRHATDNTFKLAAEARSVSVDFLNLADKSGQIDKKNIYESDTLKRIKAMDSMSSLQSNPETINLYPAYPSEKLFSSNDLNDINTVRRTHSLEGLLENVLNESISTSRNSLRDSGTMIPAARDAENENSGVLMNTTNEGSQIWEEDSLWRERLRSASQRHTRSLDDLDNIFTDTDNSTNPKPKQTKHKLHRGVTYVNENVLNLLHLNNQAGHEMIASDLVNIPSEIEFSDSAQEQESTDSNKNEVWNITSTMAAAKVSDKMLSDDQTTHSGHDSPFASTSLKSKKPSFIIDRETLRQWDLLSSAPSGANGQSAGQPFVRSSGSVVDIEQGSSKETITQACEQTEIDPQETASGSISLTAHETFPRAISAKRIWTPNSQPSSRSATLNHPRSRDNDYSLSTPHIPQSCMSTGIPPCDMNQHMNARKVGWQWGGGMNMSAGELLGRTHEELVLLLIQLRRQSTNTCHAIETCYAEIDNIQSQLNTMDAAKRLENLQKLEQLKQHLLELEKQYEKGKPLVNLVDNMVKLGSLYRSPNDHTYAPHVRDRLEFNQQIQERRLLAEERRDWNRLSPNHLQLQAKVQQLYQLDRLLQEESGTLQGLQLDKEKIERALGGLRHRLNRGHNDPTELEQARKQQTVLENELSRVHYMLAQNSKKLEETVAGNARLEQELLVLRQKLQLSRQQRSSPQFSNAGDSLPCAAGTSAMLESELHRVQQLVGDLQRQRQELSIQVRQLTDRSHTLSQQIRPTSTTPVHFTQGSAINKKRTQTSWRETDLDTMHSVDHGSDWDNQNKSRSTTPLYVNTDTNKQTLDADMCYSRPAGYDFQCSDDTQLHNTELAGCIPQEKQEIKTVRIVKRESERRQRDREKTIGSTNIPGNSGNQPKWDTVVEEDDTNPYGVPSTHNESSISSISSENQPVNHMTAAEKSKAALNRQASISSPSLRSPMENYPNDVRSTLSSDIGLDKSPALSPVFKSEAARQIIIEMSGGVASEPSTLKSSARRMVPKEKRRHYTAPHNNLIIKSLNQLPTEDSFIRLDANNRRARDDLDMERALRQRTDTPDVVRSTLSSKELKYNENTIDNILGTPNKISIPERYIPEQLPQLSPEEQQHRLRKVESIKKMLSDTAILSSTSSSVPTNNAESEKSPGSLAIKATSKMVEEKRQREHLLQLNQILAKQVMEMSKIVAVKALATLPLEPQKVSLDEDDLSPVTPLPLYQQRDNYYT